MINHILALSCLGYVAPWSGRFYSLWDTGYAKIHIPIIASVSEHQPTTWASFFFDLHILICVFPSGIWIVLRRISDERIFREFTRLVARGCSVPLDPSITLPLVVVLYGVFAAYFAGVMVRLMLTFTPIVCCLGAIAISQTLTQNFSPEETKVKHSDKPKVVAKVELYLIVVVVVVYKFACVDTPERCEPRQEGGHTPGGRRHTR